MATDRPPPALLTIAEAAARMGCCLHTVRRAIKAKRLAATQPNGKGGEWKITPEAFDAWLAGPPPSAVDQAAAVVASFRKPVVREEIGPELAELLRKQGARRPRGGAHRA